MPIIKELKRIIVQNNADGTQLTRLPNQEEMMNKINEIVREVNKLTMAQPIAPIKPASSSPRRSF